MQVYFLVFLHLLQSLFSPCDTQFNNKSSSANLVFQSLDGGNTWKDVSGNLPKGIGINSAFESHGELLLATDKGVYGGDATSELIQWKVDQVLGKSISNISNGWAGPYAISYGNGVYQKIIGTSIWVPMDKSLGDKMVRTILEIPGGIVFIASDNGIYKSMDGRKTWKKVFSEGMVLGLMENDGVLFAAGFKGVLKSVNGGEQWDWVFTEDGMAFYTGMIDGRLTAITSGMGPWGMEKSAPFGIKTNRLRTSVDGGRTWQRADAGLSNALFNQDLLKKNMQNGVQFRPSVIKDIDQLGEYLYCSLDAGLFRSADHGITWQLIFSADDNKSFETVIFGKSIYVVSVFSGC